MEGGRAGGRGKTQTSKNAQVVVIMRGYWIGLLRRVVGVHSCVRRGKQGRYKHHRTQTPLLEKKQ